MRRKSLPFRIGGLSLVLVLSTAAPAPGDDDKFEKARKAEELRRLEEFVLASDRTQVLRDLIPGSEEYYYWHALHYQNTRQKKKLDAVLEQWRKGEEYSNAKWRIEFREALLNFDNDPEGSLKVLRDYYEPYFDHKREAAQGEKSEYPSVLDQSEISTDRFLQEILDGTAEAVEAPGPDDGLNGISDAGLFWFAQSHRDKLDTALRRSLLKRADHPSLPNLVQIILDDLASKESKGFGEFEIHKNLLLSQLEEIRRKDPTVMKRKAFVTTWITKLRPAWSINMDREPAARTAYLDELWAFVQDLEPAFNSLKLHVLHHLVKDRWGAGKPVRILFQKYIAIPRSERWCEPKYYSARQHSGALAKRKETFLETSLSSLGDDESFVREIFIALFRDGEKPEPWTKYVRASWLMPVYAEALLTAGKGDPEKLTSMLKASAFEKLNDRVDIAFAPDNPGEFAMDDLVKLAVDLKNVPRLSVRIFKLNALNYYREKQREINITIDLDGLPAVEEKSHTYSDPPLVRTRRSFEFPSLTGKRGTWVIEFTGNGVSSRALVRKGRLQQFHRAGSAGHVFTIVDENRQPVADASIDLGGRRFTPAENGSIIVPFSTNPKNAPIILSDGEIATLDTFNHSREQYDLEVQFHIERESLLSGQEAAIALRPQLTVSGAPASLKLLERPVLVIKATTMDGTETTDRVGDLELSETQETVHTFTVPPRLHTLNLRLEGTVGQLSLGGQEARISSTREFTANEIESSDRIAQGFFTKSAKGDHTFELRGRNGEPIANRELEFWFWHERFTSVRRVTLSTNANGRVELGKLDSIVTLTAAMGDSPLERWDFKLPRNRNSNPDVVHLESGAEFRLAVSSPESAKVATLYEKRAGGYARDAGKNLRREKGYLVVSGLQIGEFHLHSPDRSIDTLLRVLPGTRVGAHVLGRQWVVPAPHTVPVQIEKIEAGENSISVQLANAGPATRVHVAATHFLPQSKEPNLGANLWPTPPAYVRQRLAHSRSASYASGRILGDEYRYILERRNRKVFPGNMLPRPGLLLNPWSEVESSTPADGIGAGSGWLSTGKKGDSKRDRERIDYAQIYNQSTNNLDFIRYPSPVLYNLTPDKNGLVSIPRVDLRGRPIIRIFAQNAHSSASRMIVIKGEDIQRRDRRLLGKQQLDPNGRFVQHNAVSVLRQGDKLQLKNATASAFEIYDNIGGVLALFDALGKDLDDFWFLADWADLSIGEKREHYSEFACHELNFFLSLKDPDFFASVVRPYLQNKKDKTFLDHYLLGDDMEPWLEEWRYLGLNAAERVLLAGKLADSRPATQRDLRDYLDTLPDQRMLETSLFGFAIGAQAMSRDGAGSLHAALGELDDVESSGRAYNRRKIDNIIIPSIDFEDATVEEAIEFLRQKAIEHDPMETDPSRKGISFILRNKVAPGGIAEPAGSPITLKLSNVPLSEVLRYVTELAGLKYKVEPYAIVITPQWDTGTDLFTRTFRVPPDFLMSGQSQARKTAREILESMGIVFPEGASAVFQPQTSTLIVRNTQANMELVEQFTTSQSPGRAFSSGGTPITGIANPFASDGGGAALDDPFAPSDDPFGGFPMTPATPAWDADNRGTVARFYQKLDGVSEWAENNYYQLPIAQHGRALVEGNRFWLDVANTDEFPLLSSNFAFASSNRTESLLALALLDLPFESPTHQSVAKNDAIELTAAGNAIVFHRQFVPAKKAESPLMVARHFFRADDRFHHVGNTKRTKILLEGSEFLTGVVYGCQIVVTNPSDVEEQVDLLIQIPEGALPVSAGLKTHTDPLNIPPFSAGNRECFFYFPTSGKFTQYPVQVSNERDVLTSSPAFSFEVRNRRTEIDRKSWSDISQFGSADEVLEFLKTANLHRIDLERMFWRLKDKAFFESAIAILRQRQTYSHDLYIFGLLHGSKDVIRQFITNDHLDPEWSDAWHDGAVLDFDPAVRQLYEHLDYDPFVNARAHPLGGHHEILNPALAEQVKHLLRLLAHKPASALTDGDRLSLVYYLLLQDRVEDAIPLFEAIDREKLAARLQYDYCACYLAFSQSDPEEALRIAGSYKDHPVDRWRARFASVISQAEEARQAVVPVVHDEKNREQQHEEIASSQPGFEFKVENQTIRLAHRNLKEVTVNYYEMDLEFLFSANPFLKSDQGRFSFVDPNESQRVVLKEKRGTTDIPLPKRFHQSDVLVEVTGGGQKKTANVFDNELNVAIAKAYGRLRVTHAKTGAPVSKAYVKVYALHREADRKDPFFFKDGYTDLRGKFDYASLNSGSGAAEIEDIASFAILVMSESHGSEVREVDGPFGGQRLTKEPPPAPKAPEPPADPFVEDDDDPF